MQSEATRIVMLKQNLATAKINFFIIGDFVWGRTNYLHTSDVDTLDLALGSGFSR